MQGQGREGTSAGLPWPATLGNPEPGGGPGREWEGVHPRGPGTTGALCSCAICSCQDGTSSLSRVSGLSAGASSAFGCAWMSGGGAWV